MGWWLRVRESFWFLPALLCALAVVLAEALIVVDQRVDEATLGPFAVLIARIGESGSRDVLGAIAGSVLTVAATSFSITIAVLATASSTYGPRLVRNFMNDRGNRFVLGVFTGTFLYSLLVLRSIREPSDADEVFVPHLAVNVAVLLAVLAIGVLVYFINHIAASVQVFTLSRQVRVELLDAVDRLYPEQLGRPPEQVDDAAGLADVPAGFDTQAVEVAAQDIGYLRRVDVDRLLALATEHDLLLALRVRPGNHLIDDSVVTAAWPPGRVDDGVRASLRSCFATAPSRSPYQDIEFAVVVLEEMAVRALSPSTNDPYTALNALDDLAAGLVRLAGRHTPSAYRYDARGSLRVIAPTVTLADLAHRVFAAIRWHALAHPPVLHRTVDLAAQIGRAGGPEIRDLLEVEVEHMVAAFERSDPQECDLAALRRHANDVRHTLHA